MNDDPTTRTPKRGAALLDPLAVCTLSADGSHERLAWIRQEILPHAVGHEVGPDWIVFELEDAPGLAAKLDELVARERECCAGIAFEAGPGATAGGRRLTVRGIDPRAAVFAPLRRSTPPR